MADEKQYLSRIRLIDGTTVNIKDQEARLELDSIFARLAALEKIIYNDTPISEFDVAEIINSGLISDTDNIEYDVIDSGTII